LVKGKEGINFLKGLFETQGREPNLKFLIGGKEGGKEGLLGLIGQKVFFKNLKGFPGGRAYGLKGGIYLLWVGLDWQPHKDNYFFSGPILAHFVEGFILLDIW